MPVCLGLQLPLIAHLLITDNVTMQSTRNESLILSVSNTKPRSLSWSRPNANQSQRGSLLPVLFPALHRWTCGLLSVDKTLTRPISRTEGPGPASHVFLPAMIDPLCITSRRGLSHWIINTILCHAHLITLSHPITEVLICKLPYK